MHSNGAGAKKGMCEESRSSISMACTISRREIIIESISKNNLYERFEYTCSKRCTCDN